MLRALVLGHAISTVKHATLGGYRLLVMQPLDAKDGPDGDPAIVVDTLGAGVGSVAIITNDGKAARELIGDKTTPARYTTVGLEDPS